MNGMCPPQAQDGPPPLRAAFGRELAHWREQRGKTQAGLARRLVEEHWLDECSQSYVAHVEAGRKPPPRGMAEGADQILETGGALARLWPWVEKEEQALRQRRTKQVELESRRQLAREPRLPPIGQRGAGLLDDTAVAAGDGSYLAPFPVMLSDGRVEYMRLPRRMFLTIGGASLAGAMTASVPLTADDLDRLDLAIEAPDRVDMPMVGYFRTILADHRRADDFLGAQHLRFPVLVQLAIVERFIQAANGRVKRELQRVGAEYAQLAWWFALDAGDLASARRHWERARSLALDAGDHGFISYLYTRKIEEVWHTTRNALDAREAAEAAARPEYRTTAAVLAETSVKAACAATLSGDLNRCRAHLDRARAARQESDPELEPPWIYWVDEGAIARNAGAYLDLLGQPALALAELDRALDLLPETWVSHREHALAAKAAAHAAVGEPEISATVAAEALDLIEQTGSAKTLRHLRTVDERLARWPTIPAVREFHDRYLAATSASSLQR